MKNQLVDKNITNEKKVLGRSLRILSLYIIPALLIAKGLKNYLEKYR